MIAKMAIDKKREGGELSEAEIRGFIDGFTHGRIPDCQMAALAMAICCRGMSARETAALTATMRDSGATLSWEGPSADKHSTGGVGDKLSLVIQPLAACCGVKVPSLVGRGLGLTGGTADKMEAVPGYNCALTLEKFRETVEKVGVSLATQTAEIAPADRKLYALRDVTGTVASLPLIVASILSKKLAEGADAFVFDVKCGRGAFMKSREEAIELAQALIAGATANGRKAAALVTDMSAPLGRAVGNANEVAEALEILEARGSNLEALCVEFAALMVSLALGKSLDDAREECRRKLADGSACAKFVEMVEAQGGSIDAFKNRMKESVFKFTISSPKSGFIADIDAEKVAEVALRLGAGRQNPDDRIDHLAGVNLCVGVGDRVSVASPLATIVSSVSPDLLEQNADALLRAFVFSPEKPPAKELVLWKSID